MEKTGTETTSSQTRSGSIPVWIPSSVLRFPFSVLPLPVALGLALFLISTALPWLAERGWAGKVVEENLRLGRDATALFYTESERVGEIVKTSRPLKKIEPPLKRRQAVKQ